MMIDRDTVLVVTGERELTRFHRDGRRTRIELPFAPIATQLSTQIFAVDARGSTHRFSLDGKPEGVVQMFADIEPRAAALSLDGSRLAVLGEQVRYFELGIEHPWSFQHRAGGDWRETGVGLSGDGKCVLVEYEVRDAQGLTLGDRIETFAIVRRDGVTHFRHMEHALPELEVAMSHDARRIAYRLHDGYVRVAEGVSMARLHLIEPKGPVHAMRWFGERLAILFDYELVIVDHTALPFGSAASPGHARLVDEAVTRIALPEHFVDVVLGDGEAVCVHPELGAWWITTATAAT
jgi:hypothetical protein